MYTAPIPHRPFESCILEGACCFSLNFQVLFLLWTQMWLIFYFYWRYYTWWRLFPTFCGSQLSPPSLTLPTSVSKARVLPVAKWVTHPRRFPCLSSRRPVWLWLSSKGADSNTVLSEDRSAQPWWTLDAERLQYTNWFYAWTLVRSLAFLHFLYPVY